MAAPFQGLRDRTDDELGALARRLAEAPVPVTVAARLGILSL
jgi:hypothetical protein